jgi:hypothetical protein
LIKINLPRIGKRLISGQAPTSQGTRIGFVAKGDDTEGRRAKSDRKLRQINATAEWHADLRKSAAMVFA